MIPTESSSSDHYMREVGVGGAGDIALIVDCSEHSAWTELIHQGKITTSCENTMMETWNTILIPLGVASVVAPSVHVCIVVVTPFLVETLYKGVWSECSMDLLEKSFTILVGNSLLDDVKDIREKRIHNDSNILVAISLGICYLNRRILERSKAPHRMIVVYRRSNLDDGVAIDNKRSDCESVKGGAIIASTSGFRMNTRSKINPSLIISQQIRALSKLTVPVDVILVGNGVASLEDKMKIGIQIDLPEGVSHKSDKCLIAIELLKLSSQTNGVVIRAGEDPFILLQGILFHISVTTLLDRKVMKRPKPIPLEANTICLCHGRRLNIGYACSGCLAVYCDDKGETCSVCGRGFVRGIKKRLRDIPFSVE